MTTNTNTNTTTVELPAVGDFTTVTLPDGSTCKITRTAHTVALVARYVGEALVWGQAFTPEAVQRVVDDIAANPAAFVR